MRIKFLTEQYYADYAHCTEMERKPLRPHMIVLVRAMGHDFAVPFRSHINHGYAFWTDRANGCGLDYSKAMIVDMARHVDNERRPVIRKEEFKMLIGKEGAIEQGLCRYIELYKKAHLAPENPRNAIILRYSTLRYFHSEIGIEF
jgi:protein AbiQ